MSDKEQATRLADARRGRDRVDAAAGVPAVSADKSEAQRLADALQKWFPTYGWLNNATRSDKERLAQEAAALLRRWPDGEPVAWLYEARYIDTAWTVCVGLNNPGPEGAYLRGVRPLYTAPPAESERIAERKWLDNECLDGGCQSLKWQERIAALEAALEQARVALEEIAWSNDAAWRTERAMQAAIALRKIEEVRRG